MTRAEHRAKAALPGNPGGPSGISFSVKNGERLKRKRRRFRFAVKRKGPKHDALRFLVTAPQQEALKTKPVHQSFGKRRFPLIQKTDEMRPPAAFRNVHRIAQSRFEKG